MMNFEEYLNDHYEGFHIELEDLPNNDSGDIDFDKCSKDQLIKYIKFEYEHTRLLEALLECTDESAINIVHKSNGTSAQAFGSTIFLGRTNKCIY